MATAIIGQLNLLENEFDVPFIFGGDYEDGFPITNIVTDDIYDVARSVDTDAESSIILIDLGSSKTVKFAALPEHNLSVNAAYRIRYAVQPSFPSALSITQNYSAGASTLDVDNTSSEDVTITTDDYFVFGSARDIYRVGSNITVNANSSGSITLSSTLINNISLGAVVKSITGDFTAPKRDTGTKQLWEPSAPWGTYAYGTDSFYTGVDTGDLNSQNIRPVLDVLPEPTTVQYIKLELIDEANPDNFLDFGKLCISSGWQPSVNIAYGYRWGSKSNNKSFKSARGGSFFKTARSQRTVRFMIDNIPIDEAFYWKDRMDSLVDTHKQIMFIFDSGDTMNIARNSFLARLSDLDMAEYKSFNNGKLEIALEQVV